MIIRRREDQIRVLVSTLLLFTVCFTVQSVSLSDLEIRWHPKFRFPANYESLPQDDKMFDTPAGWYCDGDTYTSPYASCVTPYDARWSQYLVLFLVNKTTGQLVKEPGTNSRSDRKWRMQSISENFFNGGNDTYKGQFCNIDGFLNNRPSMLLYDSNFGMHQLSDETPQYDNVYSTLAQYQYPVYCRDHHQNFTFGKAAYPEENTIGPYQGMVVYRNLAWRTPFPDNDRRFLRFTYHPNGNDDEYVYLDSPYFKITKPENIVHDIMFDEAPPTEVIANNPISFKMKAVQANSTLPPDQEDIRYPKYSKPGNSSVVTSGFTSKPELMLQVDYRHKWFHSIESDNQQWLSSSEALLSGGDVIHSKNTNDRIAFKKMNAGRGTVTAQIEDCHDGLMLNFTLLSRGRPFRRVWDYFFHKNQWAQFGDRYVTHNNHRALGDLTPYVVKTGSVLKYNVSWPQYPEIYKGVIFHKIKVKPQTPGALRIVPGTTIKPVQYANRPIKNALMVELLDVNGYRITSGSDSNLDVSTSLIGTGELSAVSTFKLNRGIGIFDGSVVGTASNVQLQFSVASSNGTRTTNASAKFNVSVEMTLLATSLTANQKKFIEIAVNDHSIGRLSYLPSRSIKLTDIANSVANAGDLMTAVKDDSVVAMLGSGQSAVINMFAPICESANVPMIIHNVEDATFALRIKYKQLYRASFVEDYNYNLMASFFNTRHWNNVVIIKEVEKGIPQGLIGAFNKFGIAFSVLSLPDQVVDSSTTFSDSAWDLFFDDVKQTRVKLILPITSGAATKYLIAESAKHNITSGAGYQWLGGSGVEASFPYDNEDQCASLAKKCTDLFHSFLFFTPHYETRGMTSLAWTNAKTSYGSTPSEEEGAEFGQAYDAVAVLAATLHSIVETKGTITDARLKEEFLKVTHDGLTGNIKFSANGERRQYSARLKQLQIATPGTDGKSNILKHVRFLYMNGDETPENVDGASSSLTEYTVTGQSLVYATMPSEELNDISIKTIDGTWNADLTVSGSTASKTVVEKTFRQFYCSNGCGGQLASTTNRDVWANGLCVKHETCSCNIDPKTALPGYIQPTCDNSICVPFCKFGSCTSPSVCTCNYGYVSSENRTDCDKATCKDGCVHGNCISADNCVCKPGHYGIDCAGTCACENGGDCSEGSGGDGACTCKGAYVGETCATNLAAIVAPTVIGTGLVIALIVWGVYRYMARAKLMAALMSMDWKVNWDDIRLRQKKNKSSIKSLVSIMSMMSARSGKVEDRVVCQNQGNWNGKEVVIKQLNKEDIELTNQIRWEIKQMKDIAHPNICQFIGAVIEHPNVAILNEVCGKGSLEDILYNDDIDLGWEFRFSILKDVVRGMIYLSKSDIGSHGRLKSSNCLIDNKWTAKIADYGMKEFKKNQHGVRIYNPGKNVGVELPTEEELAGCDYYNLLWTAPEYLGKGVSHLNHVEYGSIEADMYSFAVIMTEMATRNHPFNELDHLGPDEIVPMLGGMIPFGDDSALTEFTMADGSTIKSLRPELPADLLPETNGEQYMEMVLNCWHHDPSLRPTFSAIQSQLNSIAPMRGDLMDNLIDLMTHYTNSLELVISERTADLNAEKDASDLLLSKMLPPMICEELKTGKNPIPEFFNCVTIYFSDVVGFNKICNEAKPVEVVNLLNDLYSVMDDVIDTFDCYKVETIADSYVVASGLPIRNGDKHAGEIASMALHLLASINNVSYAHLPGSQVQLRVGINSGPIVGGVVGLRMPRYCLFGDTMNTASRMESGGYALKIHISESTQKILESLGGYIVESRGVREIKGKGKMTTYWLKGKEGLDLEYPSEDKAASLSLHEFK